VQRLGVKPARVAAAPQRAARHAGVFWHLDVPGVGGGHVERDSSSPDGLLAASQARRHVAARAVGEGTDARVQLDPMTVRLDGPRRR